MHPESHFSDVLAKDFSHSFHVLSYYVFNFADVFNYAFNSQIARQF